MEETKIEDFKESGRDEKFQQIVRRWKASKRVESWLRNALGGRVVGADHPLGSGDQRGCRPGHEDVPCRIVSASEVRIGRVRWQLPGNPKVLAAIGSTLELTWREWK